MVVNCCTNISCFKVQFSLSSFQSRPYPDSVVCNSIRSFAVSSPTCPRPPTGPSGTNSPKWRRLLPSSIWKCLRKWRSCGAAAAEAGRGEDGPNTKSNLWWRWEWTSDPRMLTTSSDDWCDVISVPLTQSWYQVVFKLVNILFLLPKWITPCLLYTKSIVFCRSPHVKGAASSSMSNHAECRAWLVPLKVILPSSLKLS